jgi:hypothetical protein
MEKRTGLVLGIAGCLIFISTGLSFSQEPATQAQTTPETQVEPQTQWLWGEVVSVDTTNKTLSVKYLDYEIDQEKDIAITTNDQTSYENVNSLSEIKIKDALSIDYIVSADGKNIAKLISVEKPESEPSTQEGITPAVPSETASEESQPIPPEE